MKALVLAQEGGLELKQENYKDGLSENFADLTLKMRA